MILHRVLLVGCVFVFAGGAADAQQRAPQTDYASLQQLPDWSGLWVIPHQAFGIEFARQMNPKSPDAPQFTAVHLKAYPAFALGPAAATDPSIRPLVSNTVICRPTGMPNVMRYAFGIEFLFTPGRVTMLMEMDSTIRRIYTDGRSHAADAEPTYTGESIGRWEGQTLVVHTRAISPKAELVPGVKDSGQTQVTERIFLKDPTHLQIDTVVQDPVALMVPWRYSRIYERSDTGFFEIVCDNNRSGTAGDPDLTPPVN